MKNYFGIFAILIVINGFKTFKISDSDLQEFSEYVSPKFTAKNSIDYFTYPDNLVISFQINGFDVFLNSKRKENNNNVNSNILDIPGIIRTKDGIYKTPTSDIKIEEYEDVEHKANFLLHCKDSLDTCKMHGTFYFHEQQYSIQPDMNKEEKRHKNHIVKKISSNEEIKHPFLLSFDSVSVEQTINSLTQIVYNKEEHRNAGTQVRHKRSVPGKYLAELYFVADYTMFDFFSTNFGGSTSALNYMVTYFKSIITEMQVRFDQMKKTVPGLDFDVVLIGYDIATDSHSSSWSSNNEITDGAETFLDAGPARSDFEKFLNQNLKVLNVTPDGILAFTRRTILTNPGSGYVRQAGFGWPSICTFPYNFQIITDPYSGNIGRQATHFLGQMMFMKTDSNTLTCSETDDDMYIMSGDSDNIFPTRNRSSRPWEWSSCLNTFGVIGQTLACLQDNRNTVAYSSMNSIMVAGELFDIEEQCKLVYGANSTNCTEVQEDICFSGIGCTTNNGSCINIVVKDGTSCGEGRWCNLGSCLDMPTTEAAPTTTPVSSGTTETASTLSPVIQSTTNAGPSNILGGTNPAGTSQSMATFSTTNALHTTTDDLSSLSTGEPYTTIKTDLSPSSTSEGTKTDCSTRQSSTETTNGRSVTPFNHYTEVETSTPAKRTTYIPSTESATTTVLPTLQPIPKQCKLYLRDSVAKKHRRRIGLKRTRW